MREASLVHILRARQKKEMNDRLHKMIITSQRLVGIAVACLLGSAVCHGDTINFGEATHPPGDTLQVGAITISGSPVVAPGGQPATIAGTGLGSATIGPADSIDRQMHFTANGFPADSDAIEGLTFSVDGHIDSITFTPQFFVSGLGGPAQIPFQVMFYPLALAPGAVSSGPMSPTWITVNPANPGPVTYTGIFASREYSSFSLSLQSSGNPSGDFFSYLQNHNFPDTTFQFGVRVDSISFTASGVPEPSAFSLFGLGLLGLGWQRWRGKKA